MKLISLLIGLIVVMYLVNKQLAPDALSHSVTDAIEDQSNGLSNMLSLPTSPKDINKFEQDLNQLVEKSTSNRNEELEKAFK